MTSDDREIAANKSVSLYFNLLIDIIIGYVYLANKIVIHNSEVSNFISLLLHFVHHLLLVASVIAD